MISNINKYIYIGNKQSHNESAYELTLSLSTKCTAKGTGLAESSLNAIVDYSGGVPKP